MTALLEVRDLVVAYGGVVAVSGLSFSVEEGRTVALIGPNGAGKTTVLNAISGLIRPVSGEIYLAAQRISGLPPHRIVAAGLVQVPEGRAVLGRLTVEENLLLGARLRRDRAAVRAELEAVQARFPLLARRWRGPAADLSGGEQQMLAIARALLAAPRLLLMDEPSMGLAPRLVRQVFGLVRELAREDRTILLVEQNARQALALSDDAHLLERGRIVRSGPAARLLDDPDVVASYLGGPVSP